MTTADAVTPTPSRATATGRPTGRRPVALTSLRRARELFLSGQQLPDGVPQDVVAAWRRARFFGVRHDVGAAPPVTHPPADSALLDAARPVLERIAPTLTAGAASLVLTDERLRVLWTGGPVSDTLCRDLSEQRVGHNSAALALHTHGRAEVHGPEHFLDLWQEVSAVSVPVRAPETGRARGTVTVACALCAECGPHPGAPLAEATAVAVEAELLARSGAAERLLLDAYLRISGESGDASEGRGRARPRAVVALDGRNRLVSEAARRLLSPEGLDALERGALALMRGARTAHRVPLPDGSAHLSPVAHQGTVVGAVAVLEPARHLGGPAARTVSEPGARSLPWRHAAGRAAELAADGEPVLLIGERGTGKTSLARELAPDAVELDAAEGELNDRFEELTAGRRVLVRHAEQLAQTDTAALNSLLAARPALPLLVTYTPDATPGPCLQRLLDTLAARSVTLPALRERPEDISGLTRYLTPSGPPLTWSLDALRALEQYPWPGNVTELAHLVRTVAEHRRTTGPVRRADLPGPVREGPASRPLTPMEEAERTAILEALRLHGGNKARTAAALGIGRATLYRKLRGYRGT
ncbi:helix-turn-helix domain-containing protein [Streptomyces sp. NPDC090106]|uniref:helix-turn-helix domain-containing protein n=1 Tax=Streptomyces sp. NPDC090106 TaxID=3365946 RepID=UPI00380EB34E